VERIKADLRSRADHRDEAVQALRDLVAEHDPLQLIPAISLLTSTATWTKGDRVDDGDQTFSWDAKIEYLAGLVLAGPVGDADVGEDATVKAIDLTAEVFEAAKAGLFLTSVEEGATDNPTLDLTSYMMQVERLVDRMHGYAVYLEEINDAVFDSRRRLYLDVLGFCPSDVVRVVRRHNRWVNTEVNRVVPLLASSESMSEEDLNDLLRAYGGALDAACLWSADALAHSTGFPSDQMEAMLAAMSTEFGSQADFRVPGDDNVLRTHPFIRSEDSYLVPLPWSPAHCVHDWLVAHLDKEPNAKLREAYFKGRSDAAERLVQSSLDSIFGDSVVHANVHYDGADGHGEVDCLVGGGTPVVVEVKSQSVTDPGRRGRRDRLERVVDELLGRSFDQTGKATAYINEGGRTFASKQGDEERQLLHDDVADPVQIVVSFEGIDPLAISMSALTKSESRRPVWLTDLADFLLVRDLLWDPASFLHFARTRSNPTGPVPYMETDAVAGYLEDRLVAASESEDLAPGPEGPLLRYNSGLINDYYTKSEMGYPAEPPGPGIPDEVREALRVTGVRDNSILWRQVASAVMEMTPADWGRWKHFHRRDRTGRIFTAPSGSVGILRSADVPEAEIAMGNPPTLVMPESAD
jgi:hypothetical protein